MKLVTTLERDEGGVWVADGRLIPGCVTHWGGWCWLVLFAVAWLFSPRTVTATTIDPLIWQEMAGRADFIGIVECELAGGIVAHYRVVESWKGPHEEGDRLRLKVPPNFWGPQFPITLAEDRYLVAAYQHAPNTLQSTTVGGGVPLWWRDLPYDLCFEDEEAGLAALRRLEALEGPPGAWAALTRARRGHKDAVERALEVFISDVFGMAGELNRNLQRRLLVLFSNSARASGLAQPDLRRNRRGAASGANRELFDSLQQWWRENREQIELRDPWLPELAGQKID